MKKTFLLIIIVLTFSLPHFAEIVVSPSVEWMTCKSQVIVIGKIEMIKRAKPNGRRVTYDEISVSVSENLKGSPNERDLVLEVRSYHTKRVAKDWVKENGDIFLFFLKKSDRHKSNNYEPTFSGYPISILNLTKRLQQNFDKDAKPIPVSRDIVGIVKKWVNSNIEYSISLLAKLGSIRSYAIFVLVPAEEKYRKVYLRMAQSTKSDERKKAASELYKFPGPGTEAVLRKLLEDKTEYVHKFAADVIFQIEYSVAYQASRSLYILGKPAPKITLTRKPKIEERRLLRRTSWTKRFSNALSDGWVVVSVEDGDSREIEERDTTSVIVTCENKKNIVKFILIPNEWDKSHFPDAKKLGEQKNSQGARHFFYDGMLQTELRNKLVRHFGLEP